MALHDHERRMAHDYMHDSRTPYDEAGAGSSWVGISIGIAVIAFIVFMLFAAADPTTTGDAARQTPPTTSTTPVAPATQPK